MKKVAPKKIEEPEVVPPSKIKKDFDFEGHEVVIPDKVEVEEEVETPVETDELAEEAELDEEEINPFKDKWEE